MKTLKLFFSEVTKVLRREDPVILVGAVIIILAVYVLVHSSLPPFGN